METDKFERLVKALAALAYPRPVNVLPGNAPGWVGLTDEEILQFWHGDHGLPGGRCANVVELARFLEAKLKERNT